MDDKYISVKMLLNRTTRRNGVWDAITNAEGKGLTKIVRDLPPADVIPRATIESGIEEAIALLNAIRSQAINGDGQLDYPAYLELHDAITGILPGKEADSDG